MPRCISAAPLGSAGVRGRARAGLDVSCQTYQVTRDTSSGSALVATLQGVGVKGWRGKEGEERKVRKGRWGKEGEERKVRCGRS